MNLQLRCASNCWVWECSNQMVLEESRVSVSSAFNDNFSGQSASQKGCSDVPVFMSCVIGMAEDMWQGVMKQLILYAYT